MATTEMSFPFGPKVGDPIVMEGAKMGVITKVDVKDGKTYVTADIFGARWYRELMVYSIAD